MQPRSATEAKGETKFRLSGEGGISGGGTTDSGKTNQQEAIEDQVLVTRMKVTEAYSC